MMTNFRKLLIINFTSSSGATIIQFIVSLILARLLTPQEIGIYSISLIFISIAHVFREFGVGSYLQREDDLTTDKIRSAMGVAYVTTWLIALCIFISSGWVSAYFGYAEIRPVMHVLAISFLFIPFSSVALSLLMRDFDAVKIAWATAWGTIAYSVTCLSLAYAGFGTISLAWANLANIMATGFAYIWLRPAMMPWIPSLRNTGGVIRFGGGALLSNLLKTANDALPDLLLGKMGSARQVGLISRANSTVNIFLYVAGSAINFGSQSYLAKAFHAKQPLEPILNRAVALITGIGWPMLAVTAIAARDVILVLYGKGWIESAPAIPPLALMAAISLMFNYNTAAFNAIGKPYLSALPLAVTAISRISFALLLFSGDLVSFAWILLFATMATIPISLILQQKYLQCGILSFFAALAPAAITSIACAITSILTLMLLDNAEIQSPLFRMMILAVPVFICWIISLKLFSHPVMDEINIALDNVKNSFLHRKST